MITKQPTPVPNNNTPIVDIVIEDYLTNTIQNNYTDSIVQLMEDRKEFGLKKYGTVLQAKNGRNPLVDAIEEKLDGIFYICQAIEENMDIDNNLIDLYMDEMKSLEVLYMVAVNNRVFPETVID